MNTATVCFLIADELWPHGKKVNCNIKYDEADDTGFCNVYFGGKSKPSMQLHKDDIAANSI